MRNTEPNFMEHLKSLLPAGGNASELEAAAQALAGLSPEDRDLLAAVQGVALSFDHPRAVLGVSRKHRVFCPGAQHPQGGGCGLAQHLDVLLPSELLDASDPVPFGNHAMREEQDCFTSRGYLTLSGDEWEHERPRERQTEKSSPSGSGWRTQSGSARNGKARTSPPRSRTPPPGAERLMSRSKKWRLEWAFFLGENGRRQYNKLCKGCVHPCKQSFRAVVVSCPH